MFMKLPREPGSADNPVYYRGSRVRFSAAGWSLEVYTHTRERRPEDNNMPSGDRRDDRSFPDSRALYDG